MKRSLVVATAAVYAAMYAALALVFSPLSYGVVQLRIANVLIGLVPLIGWPAVLGQALGVFIANQPAFGDPLGPIDLVNVIPSLVFSWVLWKLRHRSVFLGLVLYSVALGVSVGLALDYVGFIGGPLYLGIAYVISGILIATAGLGYVLYRAVAKLGILQRRFGP
ncbi:MAG TPA: QueT transporter family protein [Nitrososphaerales archaeon]|nr:QueT transporter family protein [Nitrososphaerales archaeon]